MAKILSKRNIGHCAFLLFLIINVSSAAISASSQSTQQPRYVDGVESIIQSHQYVQQTPALTYWKVSPYYLSQRNESSCSLASATMLVNAARSNQTLVADQPLATQDSLLNLVKDKTWEEGVKVDGNGVTLDQMKSFVPKALEAYGLHNFTVEVIHTQDSSGEHALKLHKALLDMENSGQSFIIANFNQKFISGTMSVGHFAPLGAYDSKTKRVLIMDPDRILFEPYWVPEKRFLESMATMDEDAHKSRGYLLIKMLPEHSRTTKPQ